MKKLIVAGLAAGLLAAVPISAFAVQTIDATHIDLEGMSCTRCHFSSDTNGNEIVPGDTCGGCHINETGGYNDSSAPYAASHEGFPCQTCHNPHVSLEYGGGATALVSGTITGADDTTGTLVLSYASGTPTGDWAADPASWAAKTMVNRGLILWETINAENYSFKVSDANATTIKVEGGLPVGLSLAQLQTNFQLHYGQLIAKAVDPLTSTYRDANATQVGLVKFPSDGSITDLNNAQPNPFVTTAGDGICQKCHTSTSHWRNVPNAVADSHPITNPGEICTNCHKHENKTGPAFGFGIDTANCANCHTNYPEPPLSGAHEIHASTTTGYGFVCSTCHKGGMNEQVSFVSKPSDGSIQIGINPSGLSGINTSYDGVSGTLVPPEDPLNYGTTYEGQNNSTIGVGGSMSCSTVYCHSNGRGAELGCVTGDIGQTYISPKWDLSDPVPGDPDGDGNKCNNCHPQTWPVADTNRHYWHVTFNGLTCDNCHAATALGSDTIANKTNHANGSVDLKQGGSFYFSGVNHDLTDYVNNPVFTFDPVTKKCSSVPCHGLKAAWTYETASCISDTDLCGGTPPVVTDVNNPAARNMDPVLKPYEPSDFVVYANDPTVLYYTLTAHDPDMWDPVKAKCFGAGHAAQFGLYQINFASSCQSLANYRWMPTDTSTTLSCDYGDSVDPAAGGNGWKYWVRPIIVDNGKESEANRASTGSDDPSDGAEGYDGLDEWNNVTYMPAAPFGMYAEIGITPGFEFTDDPTHNIKVKGTLTTKSVVGKAVTLEWCGYDGDYTTADPSWFQIDWSLEGTSSGALTSLDGATKAVQGCQEWTFDYATQGTGVAAANGTAWINASFCDDAVVEPGKEMVEVCYNTSWFAVPIP